MLKLFMGIDNTDTLFELDDVSDSESIDDDSYDRLDKNLSWKEYLLYILYNPSYLISCFFISLKDYENDLIRFYDI